MMRGGKNNPRCQCCNDDVCDGFRTREKNEWKKEVEEETNNNYSVEDVIRKMKEDTLNERASHFSAFDELVTIEPQIFKVSAEEYDKLEKLLAEPPKPSERLRRLLRDKSNG
jgi:hypothetical protein